MCLYKFGNVVTFAIKNVTESSLEGIRIPQGFRPVGVHFTNTINFVLETYDTSGKSSKTCFLWIDKTTGAIIVENADALVTGTVTWITL